MPITQAVLHLSSQKYSCYWIRVLLLSFMVLLLSGCSWLPGFKEQAANETSQTKLWQIYTDTRASEQAKIFAERAHNYLGIKYRYGGNSPAEGFDCSGLVAYVALNHVNQTLPRQTRGLAKAGTPVNSQGLAVGDLVFFNTSGRANSHVGIYVGQGRFIHAPSSGGHVRIEPMSNTYWRSRFTQARRVF